MQLLKPCNVPVTLFVFAMVLTDVMPDVPWWRECQLRVATTQGGARSLAAPRIAMVDTATTVHHDPVYDYSEEDRML